MLSQYVYGRCVPVSNPVYVSSFIIYGQMVKWCAGVLSNSTIGNQEAWPILYVCTVNQWSRVKGKNLAWSSGQGHFSTVKNLESGRSSGHSTYGSDPPLFFTL